MHFSGHCCCEEVKIRLNVWTVTWDEKNGRCIEVAFVDRYVCKQNMCYILHYIKMYL